MLQKCSHLLLFKNVAPLGAKRNQAKPNEAKRVKDLEKRVKDLVSFTLRLHV